MPTPRGQRIDLAYEVVDDGDDVPRSSPRRSKRLKRGIPAIRYDDIYDLDIDIMHSETMKEALGYIQAEKWVATMHNELGSLLNSGVCVLERGVQECS